MRIGLLLLSLSLLHLPSVRCEDLNNGLSVVDSHEFETNNVGFGEEDEHLIERRRPPEEIASLDRESAQRELQRQPLTERIEWDDEKAKQEPKPVAVEVRPEERPTTAPTHVKPSVITIPTPTREELPDYKEEEAKREETKREEPKREELRLIETEPPVLPTPQFREPIHVKSPPSVQDQPTVREVEVPEIRRRRTMEEPTHVKPSAVPRAPEAEKPRRRRQVRIEEGLPEVIEIQPEPIEPEVDEAEVEEEIPVVRVRRAEQPVTPVHVKPPSETRRTVEIPVTLAPIREAEHRKPTHRVQERPEIVEEEVVRPRRRRVEEAPTERKRRVVALRPDEIEEEEPRVRVIERIVRVEPREEFEPEPELDEEPIEYRRPVLLGAETPANATAPPTNATTPPANVTSSPTPTCPTPPTPTPPAPTCPSVKPCICPVCPTAQPPLYTKPTDTFLQSPTRFFYPLPPRYTWPAYRVAREKEIKGWREEPKRYQLGADSQPWPPLIQQQRPRDRLQQTYGQKMF